MTRPTAIARASTPVRRFTGWHMLAIIVAFFGLVIGVNVMMARLALSTFSGEVVENSYVASQRFNGWLDAAKADRVLGWTATMATMPGGLTVTLHDRQGQALSGAKVTGVASHPLGSAVQQDLQWRETGAGTYTAPLPAGRWQIHLQAEAGGHRWRTTGEVTSTAGTGGTQP
ncbi:FixH family protein [Novosphingobium sp.]|uniref:FixH family protein n=1 Tax=Novosphingobium sp. TaxID=1874826 RepID=UPI003341FF3D